MSHKTKPASSVDLDQVEWLAQLSRLSLGPREAEKLRGELSSILDYFATLDKVSVGRSTLGTKRPATGGKRDDVVMPSDPDAILKGVPEKKGRYVKAPKVF
ncbi:MAG: aspartyl/glutamyl-tRNA amidotransferase subunit C [Thaumarchaeota archaeon]|nr:aspartyl/glutamyl-tRNA amidotransferase subunit C [Nitrososphaerota archaeon]